MIWPFSKKKPVQETYTVPPSGLYDIHCHLFYGMDDGPKNKDEAIKMLYGLGDLGYRGIIATPHVNHPMFENPRDPEVEKQLQLFNEMEGEQLPKIIAGGEIMLQNTSMEKFGSYSGANINNNLLIEFGLSFPPEIDDFVFRMQVQSKNIILAHVERQPKFQSNPARLMELKKRGVFLQLDLLSLVGQYGLAAMNTGWRLLEDGAIDMVSTDLHSSQGLPLVQKALNELAIFDESLFVKLASVNPKHIFDGNAHLIE